MSERTPLAVSDERNYGAAGEHDDGDDSSIDSIVNPSEKIRNFLIFVPLGSILLLAALISLLLFDFRKATAPKPTLYISWAFTPFCTAVIAWIANHTIKSSFASSFVSLDQVSECATTFLQVLLAELIRLVTLVITRPDAKLDNYSYSLYTSCWVAFGWAAAEVVASISQGYSHLDLYRHFNDARDEEYARAEARHAIVDDNFVSSPIALSQYIDDQLNDLLNLKQITELEAAYGLPITEIPIILSAIQRIDSILASLGLTLILSSAFHHSEDTIAFPLMSAVLIHAILSMLWTPKILPAIGIHTASFVATMISIGCIWVGLWRWGILV